MNLSVVEVDSKFEISSAFHIVLAFCPIRASMTGYETDQMMYLYTAPEPRQHKKHTNLSPKHFVEKFFEPYRIIIRSFFFFFKQFLSRLFYLNSVVVQYTGKAMFNIWLY